VTGECSHAFGQNTHVNDHSVWKGTKQVPANKADMSLPGHCANLSNRKHCEIGTCTSGNQRKGHMFGARHPRKPHRLHCAMDQEQLASDVKPRSVEDLGSGSVHHPERRWVSRYLRAGAVIESACEQVRQQRGDPAPVADARVLLQSCRHPPEPGCSCDRSRPSPISTF
jgi:hypothetical protein